MLAKLFPGGLEHSHTVSFIVDNRESYDKQNIIIKLIQKVRKYLERNYVKLSSTNCNDIVADVNKIG